MAHKFSFTTSFLACGALALSLAACSSTAQENETSACDAYTALVGSVDDARASLSTSSSVGDITDARDEIKTSYENLQTALDKVGKDRSDALASAWGEFDKAVDGIDSDLTVPEAAASLQEEVAGIEAAQQKLDEVLSCG